MKKKWLALVCALGLCASMTGCASGTAVYVQSVEVLAGMGGIAPGDRFTGIVESENVTEVEKDSEKAVQELFVRQGDDVTEGQELFCYDMEELQLNLDKKQLELDQLKASIDTYKAQIQTLEWERSSLSGSARLQYTLEIQSTQVDLKEAELNVKTKEEEVAKAADLLENSTVVSPIAGRIQSINESGTDQNGEKVPYILIQQAGSYRIKGVLGELQMGGLQEGTRMTIFSRTDDTRWGGTVTMVDYENPYQGSDTDRYYVVSSDEMTSSSRYPFYVKLDSTEGVLLGQHVYMELEQEEGELAGIGISSAFLCYNEDGTAYVWAEKDGRLEKRNVTLGEYNPMADVQEITGGLALSDYIAFPDSELCKEGAPTTHDQVVQETEAAEGGEV